MLPHADLFWTTVLAVLIGLRRPLRSRPSWSMQEMMPHRIGMVSACRLAFGVGGLGAAVLACWHKTSIEYAHQLTAFLPLLGIVGRGCRRRGLPLNEGCLQGCAPAEATAKPKRAIRGWRWVRLRGAP